MATILSLFVQSMKLQGNPPMDDAKILLKSYIL